MEVARKYINPEKMVTVIVGDFEPATRARRNSLVHWTNWVKFTG